MIKYVIFKFKKIWVNKYMYVDNLKFIYCKYVNDIINIR